MIIENQAGEVAILLRGKFPPGYAPPAGHVDDHGSPRQAALDEVREEVGLLINDECLIETEIIDRRINNVCRREGGDHHHWTVFRASSFSGELSGDPRETRGAQWRGRSALQAMADRTKRYRNGQISAAEWQHNPGIEDVWLDLLIELNYVN